MLKLWHLSEMCACSHKPYWKVILGAYMSLQIPTCFLEYRSMSPKYLYLACWLTISESHWTWCCFVKGAFGFHCVRNAQKLLQLVLSCNTLCSKITTNSQCEWVWLRHYIAFPIAFSSHAPFWCFPNNTKEEECRCPTAAHHLRITFMLSQIHQLSRYFMLTVQRKAAAQ